MEVNPKQWYRVLAPRPVVLISTINSRGVSNAAPFSFVMPCSVNPPLIEFSSAPEHHTIKNIIKTKNFVVNIPGSKVLGKLMKCAEGLPAGQSEIKYSGLRELKSDKVESPGVSGCFARIECKLHDKFRTGDHITVVGKVVRTYIEDRYFKDNELRVLDANPLMHVGGKRFGLTGKIIKAK